MQLNDINTKTKKQLIVPILLFSFLIISPLYGFCQKDSCKVFVDHYEKVSTMKLEGDPPYIVRLPDSNLAKLSAVHHLRESCYLIRTLQDRLKISYDDFVEGRLFHLNSFDVEYKLIDRLKSHCPNINLSIIENEISFYKSKYVKAD